MKTAPDCPVCSCCGAEIGAGERYYALPDGLSACADSDCLTDWAAPYRRTRPMDEEEQE